MVASDTLIAKLRQHSRLDSGDVSVVTLGDSYLRVAGLLREKGVYVTSGL